MSLLLVYIAGVFIFILAISTAFVDWYKINDGKVINHKYNSIVRGFVILIFALWMYNKGVLFVVVNFILLSSLYWLIFDATLNGLRDKSFFYVGKTAWIDKSFNNLFGRGAEVVMFIVKILIFIFSYAYLFYNK